MKRKKSFTLIELLIAFSIVTFAIFSFISFFPIAVNSSKDTIEQSEVDRLANQYIGYIVHSFESATSAAQWNNLITGLYKVNQTTGKFLFDTVRPTYSITANPNYLDNVFTTTTPTASNKNVVIKAITTLNPATVPPTTTVDFAVEIRVAYDNSFLNYIISSKDDVTFNLPVTRVVDLVFQVTWPLIENYDKRSQKVYRRTVLAGF